MREKQNAKENKTNTKTKTETERKKKLKPQKKKNIRISNTIHHMKTQLFSFEKKINTGENYSLRQFVNTQSSYTPTSC